MRIDPVVSLRVNGVALTPHQLEVLLEVSRQGSQRKAAEALGLATPVVNKVLRQVESKAKERLLESSPSGTKLNESGLRLAREFAALMARMRTEGPVAVGGTPVTEEMLFLSLSRLDQEASYDLVISDDDRNLRDFRAGLMDVVLLDDPLNAYEAEGAQSEDVATDRLLHIDRGEAYLRFRYGAQRIGFRHLESTGRRFTVEGSTRSISQLLKGNRSFFINESLALRKGLRLASSIEPRMLEHKIMAVYQEERPEISWLLRELKRERLGA
ncbi:MAG: LysR family transcriptional regulator [Methanomassiliicoccales archaeon]|jgi:DNA-binding transcriptional LysR family regulator|nr:LysR family transcriptional regulator [Methanomassiliicoccales archaeon]